MSNMYIDKKEFHAMFVRWHEKKVNGVLPIIPDEIALAFVDITEKYATRWNFTNYTWKDEMVSYALEICLRYASNFDPEKSDNPFGYFSLATERAFMQVIEKENKQLDIKNSLKFISRNYENSEFHDINFEPVSIEYLRSNQDEINK